jgi:YegS/Rv2252/BmrU family lipid kinase
MISPSSRKFIFLVNPKSGTAKKHLVLDEIKNIFTQKNIPFEIISTNAEGEYDFVKEKISKEKVTDIIIIGGDGSVNQVVNALRKCKVQFGIIPFGSGNGLALAAGIPKKYSAAIEVILNETAKPVDAFIINDQFSCMLSGIGFDAAVAHDFANKKSRGLVTYIQQTLANFFKATPYQFEIVLKDFSFFTEAFFISIANGNQFGNNFTIAPAASMNDGLLDIVIVQKMNKATLLAEVIKQVQGNNTIEDLRENLSDKKILYFQTPSIIIKNLQSAPLHIDGEPRDTNEMIKAEIIKDCFLLIHP